MIMVELNGFQLSKKDQLMHTLVSFFWRISFQGSLKFNILNWFIVIQKSFDIVFFHMYIKTHRNKKFRILQIWIPVYFDTCQNAHLLLTNFLFSFLNIFLVLNSYKKNMPWILDYENLLWLNQTWYHLLLKYEIRLLSSQVSHGMIILPSMHSYVRFFEAKLFKGLWKLYIREIIRITENIWYQIWYNFLSYVKEKVKKNKDKITFICIL